MGIVRIAKERIPRIPCGRRRVKYLLNADFSRYPDQGPPLTSPLQAVPGPGSLGASPDVSIAAGEAVIPGTATDQKVWGAENLGSGSGLMVLGRLNWSSDGLAGIGAWVTDNSPGVAAIGAIPAVTSYYGSIRGRSWSNNINLGTWIPSTDDKVGMIRYGTRQVIVLNGELIWLSPTGYLATTAFYPVAFNHTKVTGNVRGLQTVDLPGSGYRAWGGDWTEVTDSASNPPSGTVMSVDGDFEHRAQFTYHLGQYFTQAIQLDSSTNTNIHYLVDQSGTVYIRKRVMGNLTEFYVGSGDIVDGGSNTIVIIRDGGTLSAWVNGVKKVDSVDVADVPKISSGKLYHNLSPLDLVIEHHPYPALGVATSRLIYPTSGGAFATHDRRYLVMLQGITLPTTSPLTVELCQGSTGGKYETLTIGSKGTVTWYRYTGFSHVEIASGTVSDGGTVVLRGDGTDARLWCDGTFVAGSRADLDGTTVQVYDAAGDGAIREVACFPVGLRKILPKEAY